MKSAEERARDFCENEQEFHLGAMPTDSYVLSPLRAGSENETHELHTQCRCPHHTSQRYAVASAGRSTSTPWASAGVGLIANPRACR